ncbi:MAG: DegT/DnrJ/EryC1/StrS family aminotransferase [bacterium]|nr:DegT/DnrJ/EryC1/StrS family aminotransferase [bacterium]
MNRNQFIYNGKIMQKNEVTDWPIYDSQEKKGLLAVLTSKKWGCLNGNFVQMFEQKFAKYHGAQYGIAVTNGTSGLRIALQAANIQAGDEVIVPPYTFLATATAVLEVNAVPIFVDIEPETYNLDLDLVERAITKKTKAIIPVHFAGLPVDMDRLNAIAKKHNLIVIEDACHAHGAEWKGKKLGALGDMGVFSFQSTKNMTAGEGGIILTNNKTYAKLLRSYVNCGREEGRAWYAHYRLGGNHRMTEWQGAVLLAQLTRLDKQTKQRDTNGLYLTQRLSKIPGIVPLKRGIGETRHSYHLYIFKYKKEFFNNIPKQEFVSILNRNGIPASIGYPIPLYKQPLFINQNFGSYAAAAKKINYRAVYCPNCEIACKQEAIWLPQTVMLGSKKDMDDIVYTIESIQHKLLRS